MKREVNMNEISDGRLYGLNDMVRVGCNDCEGCFACCQGMGDSVKLDPLDVYRLCKHLNCSFEELMQDRIELNVVDGVILPNLRMTGAQEKCTFLNEEGRCSIHVARPGICRLFPLGRFYEEEGFKYFLQVHECPKENKTKIKVKHWIDTPNIRENERYILTWHRFLKELEAFVKGGATEMQVKQISLYVIQQFFMVPYDRETDFYPQFFERMKKTREALGMEE